MANIGQPEREIEVPEEQPFEVPAPTKTPAPEKEPVPA